MDEALRQELELVRLGKLRTRFQTCGTKAGFVEVVHMSGLGRGTSKRAPAFILANSNITCWPFVSGFALVSKDSAYKQ